MNLFLQMCSAYWLYILIGAVIINLSWVALNILDLSHKVLYWPVFARVVDVFAIAVIGGAIAAHYGMSMT